MHLIQRQGLLARCWWWGSRLLVLPRLTDVGGSAITSYRVQSNDGIGASGSASPITVTGLTNGTSYTFNVWAINPFGWSSPSDASGSVTPALGARALFRMARWANKKFYSSTNTIEYIVIPSTTGNANRFWRSIKHCIRTNTI